MIRVLAVIAIPWGVLTTSLTYNLGHDARWLTQVVFVVPVAAYATVVYARRRHAAQQRKLRPPR